MDEETGVGWMDSVHQDDRARCLAIYDEAFDARRSFEREFRLWRYDGEYRRIVDRGVPRLATVGRCCGYVGSGIDITERQQAQQQSDLLVTELRHRVKNLIFIIHSTMARTLVDDRSMAEARDILQSRLLALGRAQDSLACANWHGAQLRGIVEAELGGFSERLELSGPEVMLNANATQTLALALHELATNAVKYGRDPLLAAASRSSGP